jgi:hypothetical protein
MLGDYRFHSVITNGPGAVRIQEYQHASNARKLVWVAWSPTGEGKIDIARFKSLPGKLIDVQRMPLTANAETFVQQPVAFITSGEFRIQASESPLYIFLEKP